MWFIIFLSSAIYTGDVLVPDMPATCVPIIPAVEDQYETRCCSVQVIQVHICIAITASAKIGVWP